MALHNLELYSLTFVKIFVAFAYDRVVMNENVSGIQVPQSWIDEIGSVEKEDRKMKAAEMMGRFLAQIKHMVQGVHLMPLGWADIVPKILQTARVAV